MKSYFDMEKTSDKIIHLLYAGFVCDTYDDSIKACILEFGEDETIDAELKFNKLKSAFYRQKL